MDLFSIEGASNHFFCFYYYLDGAMVHVKRLVDRPLDDSLDFYSSFCSETFSRNLHSNFFWNQESLV